MSDPLRCWRCRRVLPAWLEDYAVCAESGFTLPCSSRPGGEIAQPKPEVPRE